MAGLDGAPVTLTVPETVPAAASPGAKELAIEAGTAASVAVRLSAVPAVPEITALPPPRSSASLSSVVIPPAITTVEGRAKVAFTPRTVACAVASSIVVLPPVTWSRPDAFAGMSETVAPPLKPVQTPSRVSVTSMSRTTVVPDVTVAARIFPEIAGAET